ncbi:MAG: DNA polymerase III subunit delta [Verrucomicrobiae bacterium]|nr:DNA polymerase III subunit delta [Verrucomicrobiae bacterium]
MALLFGDDDYTVTARARKRFEQWTREAGGFDHEVIDAAAANASEALRAIARLREALQTLPFFGNARVIWFKNCNFLAEERTAQAADVTDALADLARELKALDWSNVRLLITAGKVDKRRVFYKTLEALGTVEQHDCPSLQDANWTAQMEMLAERALEERGRSIAPEALAELIERVGPNPRQLDSEIEKLTLYAGERRHLTLEDVTAVCSRNRLARAFALADALGDRDLAAALRHLDEELATIPFDREKTEIGLLYGLITKVRLMLLLKEMTREGWMRPDMDYARFKAALDRIPPERLPDDPKYNPRALHPWPVYRALNQSRHYTTEELVRALEVLLRCNRDLVSRQLDEALVLQHALVRIIGTEAAAKPGRADLSRPVLTAR